MSERLTRLAPLAPLRVPPPAAADTGSAGAERTSRRRIRRVNWGGFGVFLLGVGVVEIVARLGWLTSYVPPPSIIFVALWRGMIDGDISSQIGVTLSVYARGLALAAVLAVTIGILMGTYKPVFDALKIIVEFLRPIPSVAMIPLAILFFGLGATMRITVISYAAFWPLLINTIYGVRAIDPLALDVARNFGITGREALWRVTLPSALASIATGFRVSATIALVVTITTELIAGNSGIGFFISQMEQANRLPSMYAAIFLTGVIGYLLNAMYFALERRFVFWTPASRERVT
jgi:ABC-type nitrate/sulfonate/bicarbonate transport system permease component